MAIVLLNVLKANGVTSSHFQLAINVSPLGFLSVHAKAGDVYSREDPSRDSLIAG